jgi:nucleotide-binding universal stress UspA family protein
MPNPGLLPTRKELAEQNEIVASAIKRLKREGIPASGHVFGTRKASERICEEATLQECQAIVMSADPDRNRLVADMMWSQEPQRVRKRARLPVFLVVEEG